MENLIALEDEEGYIKVSWEAPKDQPQSYNIQIKSKRGIELLQQKKVNDLSHTFKPGNDHKKGKPKFCSVQPIYKSNKKGWVCEAVINPNSRGVNQPIVTFSFIKFF